MKTVSFLFVLMIGLMINLSAQSTTTLRFDLSETLSMVSGDQGDKTECKKACDPTNCKPSDCKKIKNCKPSKCEKKVQGQALVPAQKPEKVAIASSEELLRN